MDQPTCSIYGLCDPRDEPTLANVRYVGKSVAPERRLQRHVASARRGEHAMSRKVRWVRSLLAAGIRPHLIVLDVVDRVDESESERRWIADLRALGCALTNTAEGGVGGRTLTDEARAERSARMLARWQDPVYRRRMSEVHRGSAADRERIKPLKLQPRAHCPSGHPYSEANTYVDSAGGKQCRTCGRNRMEARRRRAGIGPRVAPTACVHGHPYDEANTYWHRGRRYCRECNRISRRRRMARA